MTVALILALVYAATLPVALLIAVGICRAAASSDRNTERARLEALTRIQQDHGNGWRT